MRFQLTISHTQFHHNDQYPANTTLLIRWFNVFLPIKYLTLILWPSATHTIPTSPPPSPNHSPTQPSLMNQTLFPFPIQIKEKGLVHKAKHSLQLIWSGFSCNVQLIWRGASQYNHTTNPKRALEFLWDLPLIWNNPAWLPNPGS